MSNAMSVFRLVTPLKICLATNVMRTGDTVVLSTERLDELLTILNCGGKRLSTRLRSAVGTFGRIRRTVDEFIDIARMFVWAWNVRKEWRPFTDEELDDEEE